MRNMANGFKPVDPLFEHSFSSRPNPYLSATLCVNDRLAVSFFQPLVNFSQPSRERATISRFSENVENNVVSE